MRFGRGLGSRLWFAPGQRQNVSDLDRLVDHAQRKHAAFVPAVAREHAHSEHFAVVIRDHIRTRRRVVQHREVDPLVRRSILEGAGDDTENIFAVPLKGYFLAVARSILHRGQCLLADEVVLLPSNVEVVAKLKRVDVVVFDIFGNKGPADSTSGFIAVSAKPIAIISKHPSPV